MRLPFMKKLIREVKRPFHQLTKKMSHGVSLYLNLQHYTPTGYKDQTLLRELSSLGHFTFLPNYGNMGDIIIAGSEYQMFSKHQLHYEVYGVNQPVKRLVYGGGGLFVSHWKECYQWILRLFQNRSIERIVLLPSSFYDCPNLLEIIDERFVIFCREKQSHDYLVSSGINAKIFMEHDMAFFLTPDFMKGKYQCHTIHREVYQKVASLVPNLTYRDGYAIALFLRTDSESKMNGTFGSMQPTLDLSLCVCSDSCDIHECRFYSNLFFAGIDAADIVVTDRLHVGIASMLMGKEVFLLDNSYGKVSGVYEHSIKQFQRVHFVADVQNLSGIMEKTIATGKVRKTANLKNLERIGKVLK